MSRRVSRICVEGGGVARDNVFISYRRDDVPAEARNVYSWLKGRKSLSEKVFLDRSSIEPGRDFFDVIRSALARTAVLVIIIGPRWPRMWKKNGKGRDNRNDDLVYQEILYALRKGLVVLPVLIDDAPEPPEGQLPREMKKIVKRQYVRVRQASFDVDMLQIEHAVRGELAKARRRSRARVARGAMAAGLGAAVVGAITAAALFFVKSPTFVREDGGAVATSAATRTGAAAGDAARRRVDDASEAIPPSD